MGVPQGSRRRLLTATVVLTLLFLYGPAARAELLVNELNEGSIPLGAKVAAPGEVAPAACVRPFGTASANIVEQETDSLGACSLFGMICVMPPPDGGSGSGSGGGSGTGGGGGSGSGGGGGGDLTGGGNTTGDPVQHLPEPASLITALLGAGVASLYGAVRRRRPAIAV